MSCDHDQLNTRARTHRHGVALVVHVSVTCAACGEPFAFVGLEAGHSTVEPTCSEGGLTARLPLAQATGQDPQCDECGRLLWGLPSDARAATITCGVEHLVELLDGRHFLVDSTGAKEEEPDEPSARSTD